MIHSADLGKFKSLLLTHSSEYESLKRNLELVNCRKRRKERDCENLVLFSSLARIKNELVDS